MSNRVSCEGRQKVQSGLSANTDALFREISALRESNVRFVEQRESLNQKARELLEQRNKLNEEFKRLINEVKSLKDGQDGLKKDIQGIKAQLKAKPEPAEFKETVVNVDGDPFKGSKYAKVALIEFSDYQ